MDYQREYDESWSRADRWGSHSFEDPEQIADHILSICGKGKILDVGFGMGLLVRTFLKRGLDVHGMDVARRVVDEAEQFAPGRFKVGSILEMPYPDAAFQTVISTDCLEHIAEADVPKALAELYRVTQRHVFIQLATTQDRDKRWHLTIRDRAWWESHFFEAGFRKHPGIQAILPYESLEKEDRQITLILEKIPGAALEKYPLAALRAERDLHMDMLRENGRRSDAHIARYTLARQYVPKEGLVLDAACGLGYGSATLAQGGNSVRVVGIDSSAFAIDYASSNFSPYLPKVEFRQGDVCELGDFADGSVGLVVSFETIEHLKAPELFLQEVRRVLKPGGTFIGSVPNMWVDETGKDPNPWHFHVFDFAKLAELCQQFLFLKDVHRQTAGGGMKLPQSPRQLQRVNLPVTSGLEEAEWWIVAATKAEFSASEVVAPAQRGQLVLLTADPKHPLYSSWLPHWKLPWKAISPAEAKPEMLKEAAVLVTHDTYSEPGRSVIREAVALGTPTLILADGILEYRNTWEHPQLIPGALFQPVLGHKIACLGRSQARHLESWDNADKCEVTGSPRLDRFYGLKRRQKHPDEPFRLLVMTAFTPYFTDYHHHLVHTSLRDLKAFLGEQQTVGGFGIETVWRLTKGLHEELGVPATATDLTGREMAEVLQTVDAVITTPSTAMLEAMMLGLPVATLDYGNAPAYVQSAWRITARKHIPEVVAELLKPPEPKMLFQDTTLHDCLECLTPATPRLVQVILQMMECGRQARERGEPLRFPRRILQCEAEEHHLRENRFCLERLYPDQSALRADMHATEPIEGRFTKPEVARQIQGFGQKLAVYRANEITLGPGASKKGKLLFISHEASRTGAPTFLLNLIRWVQRKDKRDIRILLRAGGALEPQFRELGETLVTNDIAAAGAFLEGVGLIYSNTGTNGAFLRTLAPSRIPIITHVHEMQYTLESFGKSNFEEVIKHTEHFIACSKAVADGLRQHHQIPAEKVSTIYEGISIKSVREGAAAQTTREVRQGCGLAEDTMVIAACGFADWRKGPDLFVQLAALMRNYNGNRGKLAFLWIGSLPGDERGKILLHDVQQLGLSGLVKFVGEQDNPYPYLNLCDVFCLCSREDPFPLVMLEAAALAKPMLCFEKAGGAGEFCKKGGGFAVPYLNLEVMCERLIQLIEDEGLRRQAGEAAARLVRNEFDLGIVAPQILELIDEHSREPEPIPKPEPPPTFKRRVVNFGKSVAGRFRPHQNGAKSLD
jgi:ubiquinone/menaquinone biosynthesis C-methylase UbiE/glycosyltransferase involved in cell wall biosynthesis